MAAEEVAAFSPRQLGLPHVAALLGIARAKTDEAQERTLRLADGTNTALLNVDGPVRIRQLSREDVLAVPRFFGHSALVPIIGFADENGRVVLLLDVAAMARLASAHGGDGGRVEA
jgi:hypothetical protein